jgi:predicted Zn-dependent protease
MPVLEQLWRGTQPQDWIRTHPLTAQRNRGLSCGAAIFSHAMLHHRERCNLGHHTLHCGADHTARLLVPFVKTR